MKSVSAILMSFVFGPSFAMQYLVSFLVVAEIAGWYTLIRFLLSCPRGALGWYVVCVCASSWSYSLVFP